MPCCHGSTWLAAQRGRVPLAGGAAARDGGWLSRRLRMQQLQRGRGLLYLCAGAACCGGCLWAHTLARVRCAGADGSVAPGFVSLLHERRRGARGGGRPRRLVLSVLSVWLLVQRSRFGVRCWRAVLCCVSAQCALHVYFIHPLPVVLAAALCVACGCFCILVAAWGKACDREPGALCPMRWRVSKSVRVPACLHAQGAASASASAVQQHITLAPEEFSTRARLSARRACAAVVCRGRPPRAYCMSPLTCVGAVRARDVLAGWSCIPLTSPPPTVCYCCLGGAPSGEGSGCGALIADNARTRAYCTMHQAA